MSTSIVLRVKMLAFLIATLIAFESVECFQQRSSFVRPTRMLGQQQKALLMSVDNSVISKNIAKVLVSFGLITQIQPPQSSYAATTTAAKTDKVAEAENPAVMKDAVLLEKVSATKKSKKPAAPTVPAFKLAEEKSVFDAKALVQQDKDKISSINGDIRQLKADMLTVKTDISKVQKDIAKLDSKIKSKTDKDIRQIAINDKKVSSKLLNKYTSDLDKIESSIEKKLLEVESMTKKVKDDESSVKFKESVLKNKQAELIREAKSRAEKKAKEEADAKAKLLANAFKAAKDAENKAKSALATGTQAAEAAKAKLAGASKALTTIIANEKKAEAELVELTQRVAKTQELISVRKNEITTAEIAVKRANEDVSKALDSEKDLKDLLSAASAKADKASKAK